MKIKNCPQGTKVKIWYWHPDRQKPFCGVPSSLAYAEASIVMLKLLLPKICVGIEYLKENSNGL